MSSPPAFLDPPALLDDITLSEANPKTASRGSVSVRPYPYPYLAGFAISNDCDSLSRSAFEDWHAVTNGTRPVDGREGLGLEVGDSFWGWVGDGVANGLGVHDHYPDVEPVQDGANLDRIVELGKLGWLDTMHSLGNWRTGPDGVHVGMERRKVEALLEKMDRLGLKPNVFVNHADSPSNVGGPWGHYQGGDDPAHPIHCLDLLQEFGFRFHWLDVFTTFNEFGSGLTFPDRRELQRCVYEYNWGPWIRRRKPEGGIEPVIPGAGDREIRGNLIGFFNKPLMEVAARDGRTLLAFKRQRGWDQPVMETFSSQVTETDLDRLEAMRGSVVIYQHFGLGGTRGRWPSRHAPRRHATRPPVIDDHAYDRLASIAERFRAGRLLVATTGRLLAYLHLRERLKFTVLKGEERWVVAVKGIDCPIDGLRRLSASELNGLSFRLPAGAPQVDIEVEGFATVGPVKRAADAAFGSGDTVFLPWSPLEWPDG